jgi:toxin-antitoxin system PIN domain toxin
MGGLDLPDINVWLALADENHVHHGRAKRYWESESGESLAFCRITMLGLLRLSTNSRVMAGQPFLPSEAWKMYRDFRALPEVVFLAEPLSMEEAFAAVSDVTAFTPGCWTDDYLAALALETGCRVVSFDQDFVKFGDLSFFHLVD